MSEEAPESKKIIPSCSTSPKVKEEAEQSASQPIIFNPSTSQDAWNTWFPQQDRSTGNIFFYNPRTGESRWDNPLGAPPPRPPSGASPPKETETGSSQNSHESTIETSDGTQKLPEAQLPASASQASPSDTVPEKEGPPPPPPIMGVWEDVRDPRTGNIYYWNKETNETSWNLPLGATVPGSPMSPSTSSSQSSFSSPLALQRYPFSSYLSPPSSRCQQQPMSQASATRALSEAHIPVNQPMPARAVQPSKKQRKLLSPGSSPSSASSPVGGSSPTTSPGSAVFSPKIPKPYIASFPEEVVPESLVHTISPEPNALKYFLPEDDPTEKPSNISSLRINTTLTCIIIQREPLEGSTAKPGPFFVVREFDSKVIRAKENSRSGVGGDEGPSEQAIRASIRQEILHLRLLNERALKGEIRLLKAKGILGKRAPSCSLLNAADMIRLLLAFGKIQCAQDLREAVLANQKTFPHMLPEELPLASTRYSELRKHIKVAGGKRVATDSFSPGQDPPVKPIKRRKKEKMTGLDALLHAVEIGGTGSEQEGAPVAESSPEQIKAALTAAKANKSKQTSKERRPRTSQNPRSYNSVKRSKTSVRALLTTPGQGKEGKAEEGTEGGMKKEEAESGQEAEKEQRPIGKVDTVRQQQKTPSPRGRTSSTSAMPAAEVLADSPPAQESDRSSPEDENDAPSSPTCPDTPPIPALIACPAEENEEVSSAACSADAHSPSSSCPASQPREPNRRKREVATEAAAPSSPPSHTSNVQPATPPATSHQSPGSTFTSPPSTHQSPSSAISSPATHMSPTGSTSTETPKSPTSTFTPPATSQQSPVSAASTASTQSPPENRPQVAPAGGKKGAAPPNAPALYLDPAVAASEALRQSFHFQQLQFARLAQQRLREEQAQLGMPIHNRTGWMGTGMLSRPSLPNPRPPHAPHSAVLKAALLGQGRGAA